MALPENDLSVRVKLEVTELLKVLEGIVAEANTADEAIAKLTVTIQAWSNISQAAADEVLQKFTVLSESLSLFGETTSQQLGRVSEAIQQLGSEQVEIQLPKVDDQASANAEKLASSLGQIETEPIQQASQDISVLQQEINNLTPEGIDKVGDSTKRFASESEAEIEKTTEGYRRLGDQVATLGDRQEGFKLPDFSTAKQQLESFRGDVDSTKRFLTELSSQSGESVGFIVSSFKQLDLSKETVQGLTKAMQELGAESRGTDFTPPTLEEATKKIDVYRLSVDEAKATIKGLSEVTGESFKVIADNLKELDKSSTSTKQISRALAELNAEAKKLQITPPTFRQSLSEIEEGRVRVDNLKKELRKLANESGESLDFVARKLRELKSAVPSDISTALRELKEEAKDSGSFIDGLKTRFQSLGNVGSFTFGTILGDLAVKALEKIKQLVTETIEGFEEYISSIFRLEVAVRGLQRAGLDVTIQQYKDDVIALGEEFGIFSRKELADAQGRLTTFLRAFGFGFEEIQESLRAALIISEVTGERLVDVVNRLQTAIGTGRFQGIRNLGINLDESVIRKLVETERELGNISDEGTRAARSLAVLNEVTDQLSDIAPDAARIQETLVGAARQSERAWEDLKLTLGDIFAPYVIALNNAKTATFEFLDEFLTKINNTIDQLAALQAGRAAERQTRSFLEGLGYSEAQIEEQARVAFERAFVAEARSRGLDDILGDLGGDLPEKTKSTTSEVLSEWEQLWAKLLDEKEQFDSRMEELSIRTSERLVDIEIRKGQRIEDENLRFYRKLEDIGGEALRNFVEQGGQLGDLSFDVDDQGVITALTNIGDEFQIVGKLGGEAAKEIEDEWDDLADKFADIEAKLANSLDALGRKLADDIAKANRQAGDKRAKAEEKFRLNELKAERKFQEDMRRLREEFIFDLEDALRERDARQVLRLTRRFRLDQDQLKRQADLDAQARKDAFRLELEEIARQREIRIRELQIEAAARRRELIQQAEERKALLEAETRDRVNQIAAEAAAELLKENELHEQKLADIETRATREIEAENLANQRRVEALKRNSEDRLKVYEAELEAIVGIAGQVAELRAQIIAQIESIFSALGSSFTIPGTEQNRGVGYPGSGRATGGTLVANQPTMQLFGEGGPEMVTFTPLTRPQSTRNVVRGTRDARGGGGKTQIEVLLSPDLVGRVINETQQQVAEVFIANTRRG